MMFLYAREEQVVQTSVYDALLWRAPPKLLPARESARSGERLSTMLRLA